MIYVSTGGFSQSAFFDVVENLSRQGVAAFEFSGGLHTPNVLKKLVEVTENYDCVLHNYFPPPKEPFVFNLASLSDPIVDASLAHAKKAIDLSSAIGSAFYSFHAGYLIDPKVKELGNQIEKRRIIDREEGMSVFVNRVNDLSLYAAKKKVRLLIENNVLGHKNYTIYRNNPLLMTDINETKEVLEKTNSNVGLLVDVGHLKVSANTLNFSAVDYLTELRPSIEAYHLSDNDGLEDTNNRMSHDAWFWPYLRKDLKYYSIEVYGQTGGQLVEQVEMVKSFLS